ncbi:MAG TPA: hypothetical protein VKB25_11255 [Conexibacter sp.]|nr:hypothetical protein [Conexibacter sp.]
MAAMNKPLTPSRQQVAAERIAGLSAEQEKLKAAAAARREASAREDARLERSFTVSRRGQGVDTTTRPSRYLR